MTLEEAVQSGKDLVLTVEPPDGSREYRFNAGQCVYLGKVGAVLYESVDGGYERLYGEFVTKVEFAEDVEQCA